MCNQTFCPLPIFLNKIFFKKDFWFLYKIWSIIQDFFCESSFSILSKILKLITWKIITDTIFKPPDEYETLAKKNLYIIMKISLPKIYGTFYFSSKIPLSKDRDKRAIYSNTKAYFVKNFYQKKTAICILMLTY